jgi:hypothetical protein
VLVQKATDRPVSFGDASRQLVEPIVPSTAVTSPALTTTNLASTTDMADDDFMTRAAFAATSGTAVHL